MQHQTRSYMRHIAIGLVLLLAPTITLTAGGGQEKGSATEDKAKRGEIETEETREVEVFNLSRQSKREAMSSIPPGGELSFYLFQEFEISGGTVHMRSDRSFSMPVRDKEYHALEGDLSLMEYLVELSPNKPASYVLRDTVRLDFGIDELLSGSGNLSQPGRFVILEAINKSKIESGLLRIEELSYSQGKGFRSKVQFAEPAPRKK